MRRWNPIVIACGPMLLAASAGAQGLDPDPEAGALRALPAVRAPAPPIIDGHLDEAEWAAAPTAAGFVQLRPRPGEPATEHTEVRVLYDEQALYVAARLRDAYPDSVVARLARRDQEVHSDWFAVGLDSYHDRRTAFLFAVNPRGVRRDLRIHDQREDEEWDAVWSAAARVDSLGWAAEIRIPLSQLRFNAARGGAGADAGISWGINFQRLLARRDELAYWSPVPPDGAGVVTFYGELRGLRGLRPSRRVEVQPYSVLRLARAPVEPGDPFLRPTEVVGSLGADLKVGITSGLTLTATLNPDFGQVEADPSEVNLTAFESYFEEKRAFFTEGAEIFDAGWPELFYSRRIGRAPQGSAPADAVHASAPAATTILGAAKLTGRTRGGWSIGLLDAVTAAEDARFADAAGREGVSPVEPLTNYSVARVLRDFRGGGSTLGGMLTATHRRLAGERLDFLRSAAYSGGVDGRHRFGGGSYQLQGSLMGSYLLGSDSAIARVQRAAGHYLHRPDADHLEYDPARGWLGGYAARLGLGKVGGGHWRWSLDGRAYSPGFEINDLGYHFGSDELRQSAMLGYHEFHPGRLFRSWTVNVGQMSEWTFGAERRDAALDAYGEFQLHSQWGGSVWYMRHFGGLSPSALRGGPAIVWPARQMGNFGLWSDPRRPLRVRAGLFWEVEDGTGSGELRLHAALSLRAADRLEMSLRPELSRGSNSWQYVTRRTVAGEPFYLTGDLEHSTAALTARLDYTFSPALSLQLYAQPFVSAGEYAAFRAVRDPRAPGFSDRLRTLGAGDLREERRADGSRLLRVDADRDGAPDFELDDPGFRVRELRGNAVLRWEYRPGSTLFVVWSQGRSQTGPGAPLDLAHDLGRLLDAPQTNVLLVKLSYWLGL